MERWLPADCNGALALSDKIMVSTISLLLINIMVFAQCQVTQTTKRMLQVSIICMNQLTMFRQKGISLILKNCYTTSLRSNTNWGWTICSCFICSRLRNSPSCYWCQRNETQERPLSWTFWKVSFRTMPPLIQTRIQEPVQCWLGWQATHRCGRGAVES